MSSESKSYLRYIKPALLPGTTLLWQSFVTQNYASLESVLNEMEKCLMDNGMTERDANDVWLQDSDHGETWNKPAMVTVRRYNVSKEVFATLELIGGTNVQVMTAALRVGLDNMSGADWQAFGDALSRELSVVAAL